MLSDHYLNFKTVLRSKLLWHPLTLVLLERVKSPKPLGKKMTCIVYIDPDIRGIIAL